MIKEKSLEIRQNFKAKMAEGVGYSPSAKIFRLASCEQAPIGLRLKCEPTFAMQNGFSHRFPAKSAATD